MNISDDDLRRIARRVLGLISIRRPRLECGTEAEVAYVEQFAHYRTGDETHSAESIDAQASAILREELAKHQSWIQSDGELVTADPLTTVVHTADD